MDFRILIEICISMRPNCNGGAASAQTNWCYTLMTYETNPLGSSNCCHFARTPGGFRWVRILSGTTGAGVRRDGYALRFHQSGESCRRGNLSTSWMACLLSLWSFGYRRIVCCLQKTSSIRFSKPSGLIPTRIRYESWKESTLFTPTDLDGSLFPISRRGRSLATSAARREDTWGGTSIRNCWSRCGETHHFQ